MNSQVRPRVLCMVDLTLAHEALSILRNVAEVDYQQPDRHRLLERIGDCDAYWGFIDLQIDREVLDRAARLRVVCTPSTGTDHIDKEELARRGIHLLSIAQDQKLLRTFSATAECAWMLLLACHRNFRAATRSALVERHWDGERFRGHQLMGRTLGVLGLGRLGRMTVDMAKGFHMRVLGCDRLPIEIEGVERVDFDTLLGQSDAISIHIHLDPANYHLFNDEVFSRMKSGAVLVNTSRGDIINEDALLRALESGRLAAFGADVLHNEWQSDMRNSPVVRYAMTHENVVITPHMGGCTYKSIIDARVFSARKLARYLETGAVD